MARVLAIGLDAAEPSLIERWTEDGSLPTLKALRAKGSYGRLASTAAWMTGSAWPTFYTGQGPAQHGFYNYLVWRGDKMITEQPAPERMPIRPFWRALKDPAGPRIISIDVPLTTDSEPFNGKEIMSLGTHDSLVPMSGYPPEFVEQIRGRYGQQIMSNERYALQSKRDFRRTRDEMIRVADIVGELCVDLLRDEPCDLFLACFASIHRAGHRLWSLNNISEPLTAAERSEFEDAQHRVYQTCDRIIERLVDAAGPEATVLIFSLHGMGANTSKTLLLPEMLQRVLEEDPGAAAPSPRGLAQRLRSLIPAGLRHHIKSRLPVAIRHRLTAFWRTSDVDWSKTRAFSMLADMQGWIRVNLQGRETKGIVPAGEYEALCEEIAEGLRTFVEEGSQVPVVKQIVRTSQVFEGPKLDWLPDLLIQWSDTPAASLGALVSPRYGRIVWPTPGQNPEGRSGNHRQQGFLIAAGPGIKSGNITDAHILDLAPTIMTLLGQPVPPEMEGRPLLRL